MDFELEELLLVSDFDELLFPVFELLFPPELDELLPLPPYFDEGAFEPPEWDPPERDEWDEWELWPPCPPPCPPLANATVGDIVRIKVEAKRIDRILLFFIVVFSFFFIIFKLYNIFIYL